MIMAQTPCPQPDHQLQSWGSSGVCLETGLLQASTLCPTPTLLPGSARAVEYPRAKQKGSLRLLLRATCASLVCSSHQVTTALSQVQQTLLCTLVFKENHVGTVRPRALPLPLLFWAVGHGTRWEPDKEQGREPTGWKQERPVHPDHSLWLDQRLALSVSLSLSSLCPSLTVSLVFCLSLCLVLLQLQPGSHRYLAFPGISPVV